MKPRVFISSTFYDLKYIREELSNYVKAHDFEPIMFEDGDIGYTPGKKLDESCYDSMRSADMVVLIIGGEYGSAASTETEKGFEEYISVTRKEFRTAVDSGIPVFCMIDTNVNTEYGVYDINCKDIESQKCNIRFKATKNINVFRFIKEIKSIGNIPIQEFKNVSEIKDFLGKQWADMFKNYLTTLKNDTENNKIENSVNEMRSLIQKMDIMLNTIGKNVLSNPKEYEDVINQQDVYELSKEIAYAFEMSVKNEDALNDLAVRRRVVGDFLNKLRDVFKQNKWELFNSDESDSVEAFFDLLKTDDFSIESISVDFLDEINEQYKLLYDNENLQRVCELLCAKNTFIELLRDY